MFRHISIQPVLGWPQKNWKSNDRKRFQHCVILSKTCQQQNAPNTCRDYVFHPIYLEKAGALDCSIFFRETLKQKCRHFDEIFITGCTESCQNDNFRCSQWLKFHQNDNISVSVNTNGTNDLHFNEIFQTLSYCSLTVGSWCHVTSQTLVNNTLRPRQCGRHFADDILKCIFLNENIWISIKISLKSVP